MSMRECVCVHAQRASMHVHVKVRYCLRTSVYMYVFSLHY